MPTSTCKAAGRGEDIAAHPEIDLFEMVQHGHELVHREHIHRVRGRPVEDRNLRRIAQRPAHRAAPSWGHAT